MFYLSMSLFAIALLFTVHPPTFTFKKILIVEQQQQQPIQSTDYTPLTEEELKKAYADAPPTADDIVEAFNSVFYDMQGDD